MKDDGKSARCAIAVMAKASHPGRAKTRLVPPLTFEEAAAFNTVFLKDVAANILAAAQEQDIAGFMAFGPPGSEPFFREILPEAVGLIETWLPDFGDCLFSAADTLLARGYGAVCVLNADSPTLPTKLLSEAARILMLPGDRIVLGPSTDGGYYLLGVKHPHARLFQNVEWSTERVAQQTLQRAAELHLIVHTLPDWYDVDDAMALRTLAGELFEARPFGSSGLPSHPAPNTAALMRIGFSTTDLAARLSLPARIAAEASTA